MPNNYKYFFLFSEDNVSGPWETFNGNTFQRINILRFKNTT